MNAPDAGIPYELKEPSLLAIAPEQVAVGDTMQLIGADFIDAEHGSLEVRFAGWYTDENGERSAYTGSVPVTYVNAGVAEFEFGPEVIFSPTGIKTGIFTGNVSIVSKLAAGVGDGSESESESDELGTNIEVMPSLVVEYLRAVNSGCSALSSATIGNADLEFGVRAIGVGSATEDAPITFNVSFYSPAVKAMYLADKYAWYLSEPDAHGETQDGTNSFALDVTSGSILYVEPTTVLQEVTVNPPIAIGQNSYSDVTVKRFYAGPVEGSGGQYAYFYIKATTASGQKLERTAFVNIYNEWEIMPYDGTTVLVERYEPQPVSACFAGGDIGRDLQYTEGESESRSRSLSFRWDSNTAYSLSAGVFAPFQLIGTGTWSETFGVDVNETVSSETHTSANISAHIIPNYYGVCYRQTERVERTTGAIYHTACGASEYAGEVVLTDWNWGFDIATGPECPPPTNLPPGEVFDP